MRRTIRIENYRRGTDEKRVIRAKNQRELVRKVERLFPRIFNWHYVPERTRPGTSVYGDSEELGIIVVIPNL